MKFARFETGGKVRYGVIEGKRVVALKGTPFGKYTMGADTFPLSSVRLLAPCEPTKIVCLGLNYADHAKETGQALPASPLLFMKPSTAVQHPGGPIVYPAMSKRVDYEAELAIVIKKTASCVDKARWSDYVLGYTCLNDVTARDLQSRDGQWTRAKGFDTFAPVGPWITDEVSPDDLAIETRVNGVVKQKSRTSQLIFPPSFLVPFISEVMTLLPGDIIATGTPAGISGMNVGDTVEVEIEGIGVLANTVVAPKACCPNCVY
jgi:2-keto-4-pentenoate hydratase/2-oxohepta-3-ene-1,7-dioic acid hydratase in catechol pathway